MRALCALDGKPIDRFPFNGIGGVPLGQLIAPPKGVISKITIPRESAIFISLTPPDGLRKSFSEGYKFALPAA